VKKFPTPGEKPVLSTKVYPSLGLGKTWQLLPDACRALVPNFWHACLGQLLMFKTGEKLEDLFTYV